MSKILVSACLIGEPVRYDGAALPARDDCLLQWHREGRLVPFCPEVAGGLPVPRPPAQIRDGRVVTEAGDDVTAAFERGAWLALALCRRHRISLAVLTESSPSCGSHVIHDGRFSGRKIAGMGLTTALLRRHGIVVFNQYQLAVVERWLNR